MSEPLPAAEDIRDRFAMAALTGLLADKDTIEHFDGQAQLDGHSRQMHVARAAYLYADAMMKRRMQAQTFDGIETA